MPAYAMTVNAVSRDIRPGWSITETANGRNRMDFEVLSLDGAFRVVNDDVIVFTENGTRIFAGLVDNPGEAGFGGSGASAAIVQRIGAADFNVYPSRITVGADVDRPAETLKARLTWIQGLLAAQGVTLDAGQVNGPPLAAASYAADQYLVDVLNETLTLASGTGATSWVWNIDYNKVLSAKEAGTDAAPFNVSDGDGNVLGDIAVEQPRPSTYANFIILLAGSGLRYIEFERHDGNGVTRRFLLDAAVVSLVGALRIDGGAGGYPVGIYGVDDMPWTFDASTNEIVQRVDQAVIALGHYIEMSYNGQLPIRVESDGGAPAAARQVKTYATDYLPKAAAQALADSYLTRDMASPKTVRYSADYAKTGLHPGQTQTIASTKRNLAGSHLLTEVRISGVGPTLARRDVTAVSTQRLPITLREKYRQAFGGGAAQTAAAASSTITIVSGGSASGSSPLGGSRDRSQPVGVAYTPVVDWVPFVAKVNQSAQVRVTIRAREAGVTVTPRLAKWNGAAWVSDTVGSGVLGVAAAEQTVPVSLAAGTKYRLEVVTDTAGASAYAIGAMEVL